jgi:hypothetical protein
MLQIANEKNHATHVKIDMSELDRTPYALFLFPLVYTTPSQTQVLGLAGGHGRPFQFAAGR